MTWRRPGDEPLPEPVRVSLLMQICVTRPQSLKIDQYHGGRWVGFSRGLQQPGVRLLIQFPPFRYFFHFSASLKHTWTIEYHVYIWRVSPQLSCDDTCQTWKWFKESNRYFCKMKTLASGEINGRSFSNPHPWYMLCRITNPLLLRGISATCIISVLRKDRKYKRIVWKISTAGAGVTKPNYSVPWFSGIFSIIKTHISYWVSRLYLAVVAAA